MRTDARGLVIRAAFLVLAFGVVASARSRIAPTDGEIRGEILKLADAIEKGDDATQGHANEIAKKTELEDVMDLFRLRAKKGLGVGDRPGAVTPDGIEALIMNLGKRELRKDQLAAESKDLARAAYVTAAIAEIAENKCPVERKQGEKDPKSWRSWAKDMRKNALELAKASQSRNAKAVKTAATKVNSSCNACHAVFRD
jgi:Cytochrome C'